MLFSAVKDDVFYWWAKTESYGYLQVDVLDSEWEDFGPINLQWAALPYPCAYMLLFIKGKTHAQRGNEILTQMHKCRHTINFTQNPWLLTCYCKFLFVPKDFMHEKLGIKLNLFK